MSIIARGKIYHNQESNHVSFVDGSIVMNGSDGARFHLIKEIFGSGMEPLGVLQLVIEKGLLELALAAKIDDYYQDWKASYDAMMDSVARIIEKEKEERK